MHVSMEDQAQKQQAVEASMAQKDKMDVDDTTLAVASLSASSKPSAYEQTLALLNAPTSKMAPLACIPHLASLEEYIPPSSSSSLSSSKRHATSAMASAGGSSSGSLGSSSASSNSNSAHHRARGPAATSAGGTRNMNTNNHTTAGTTPAARPTPPSPIAPQPAVGWDNNISNNAANTASPSLLASPGRSRVLTKAVTRMEVTVLPQEEDIENELVAELTHLLLGTTKTSPERASAGAGGASAETCSTVSFDALQQLGNKIPRRVCQHPFRRNDIVWVCRTCQADETCVLCHQCFSQSNHEGHDVSFYHAQAGGCCDCGDPDAWDPQGFCPRHGMNHNSTAEGDATDQELPLETLKDMVRAAAHWLVQEIAVQAERAHTRASSSGHLFSTSAASNITKSMVHGSAKNEADDDEGDHGKKKDDSDNTMEVSASSSSALSAPRNAAYELGKLGYEGGGLYLILSGDEIHTTVTPALRSFFGSIFQESSLHKLLKLLKREGAAVIWGPNEIQQECGSVLYDCWKESCDRVAATQVGSSLWNRVSKLRQDDFVCAIYTRRELELQQRAVALVQWIKRVARSCDPLCRTVAETLSSTGIGTLTTSNNTDNNVLVPLLRADFYLAPRLTSNWHSLLLTLLAIPSLKRHLAGAYCDSYSNLMADYSRGLGMLDRSSFTLSVQFLNRVTYVVELVQERQLLHQLGKSLYETLSRAKIQKEKKNIPQLDPLHPVLVHRRYSPCISDLKCVLNVEGMPRLFLSSSLPFLDDWLSSLALCQHLDPQAWVHWSRGHVEMEPRGWVGAFNASITLASLFERLLYWESSSYNGKGGGAPDSLFQGITLLNTVELAYYVIEKGLVPWQEACMVQYKPTAPPENKTQDYQRCPASLPYSTICVKHSSENLVAFHAFSISQEAAFSFHLPLHRFVASCLREVARCQQDGGVQALIAALSNKSNSSSFNIQNLFWGMVEFPALVMTRVAQVRAGLWKRNGSGIQDEVLNYSEPPFCRAMRDSDLALLQFALVAAPHDCSSERFIHFIIHRLGLFDFCGFRNAAKDNTKLYLQQVKEGRFRGEVQSQVHDNEEKGKNDSGSLVVPWTFTPAVDVASSLALLEEFLHLITILITELPSPPPSERISHASQAKARIRKEVIHRLASGPKTHSELAEVHHVLSHVDNVILNQEGKEVNPDDAAGAALEAALSEVADRKTQQPGPDQWILREAAWEEYDPAFYHIPLRSHQSASEHRSSYMKQQQQKGNKKTSSSSKGSEMPIPKPYAPLPSAAHECYQRIRRDMTADASVLAIVYRTLHVHCREGKNAKPLTGLESKQAYDRDGMSETVLARAVHLLTLGAYAWQDPQPAGVEDWRQLGGGQAGSIFFDATSPPNAKDWIQKALLAKPKDLMDSEWYEGEDDALVLLKRLAIDGGSSEGVVAQDSSVRAGAAWLCEYARKWNPELAQNPNATLTTAAAGSDAAGGRKSDESDIERRKRQAKEARERLLRKMNANAAKFIVSVEDFEDDDQKQADDKSKQLLSRRSISPQISDGGESDMSRRSSSVNMEELPSPFDDRQGLEDSVPSRLLKERPRCIICADDGHNAAATPEAEDAKSDNSTEKSGVKRRKKRADGNNALAFCGYAQPSTVLKGGGGVPEMNTVRQFVGTHIMLCGHAVHSSCCDSYLATVNQREERLGNESKKGEFRCPLCQRLSNCLIPFIDVGVDWVENVAPKKKGEDAMDTEGDSSNYESSSVSSSLNSFLETTHWWVSRKEAPFVWDGRCTFLPVDAMLPSEDGRKDDMDISSSSTQKPSRHLHRRRPSFRGLRKKDVYSAWNAIMRTPRFIRRRQSKRAITRGEDETMEITTTTAVARTTPAASEENSGESEVWRRLMDHISEVSLKGDLRRLGEEQLFRNHGEFRHYLTEKAAYNFENRKAGIEPVDWPECLLSVPHSENQRQELPREKVVSKMMTSIQAFTYSCCAEASEIRRQLAGVKNCGGDVNAMCSKYGIGGTECDGHLLIMPKPLVDEDDGAQPFNGRIGKLRYLGLATMAAAGAVSNEIVQLALAFPIQNNSLRAPSDTDDEEEMPRAPIAHPVLLGHVLSHVVAAIVAASGYVRARRSSLDADTLVKLNKLDVRTGGSSSTSAAQLVTDCIHFIEIGLLARVLQTLLGTFEAELRKHDMRSSLSSMETYVLDALRLAFDACGLRLTKEQRRGVDETWLASCCMLLQTALPDRMETDTPDDSDKDVNGKLVQILCEACLVARAAGSAYLVDAGLILQILVPGCVTRMKRSSGAEEKGVDAFAAMCGVLEIESIKSMLNSTIVNSLVSDWYKDARTMVLSSDTDDPEWPAESSTLENRVSVSGGFRAMDWPTASMQIFIDLARTAKDSESAIEIPRRVALLGDMRQNNVKWETPRIWRLPTSYTDLYAELGTLSPASEQTALCLVCGQIMNAGGKGECTEHAYKCGAGSCVFFLLHECVGLIIYGGKAAYIHSPYVDSHGETPQYRGRPLNLDKDRYGMLQELWSGHLVREKVIAERSNSRQVIILGFY